MSLESTTDKEYAKLRKQYFKDANKFYKRNIRKADKYKFLDYIGAGIMAAGAGYATQMENWWFSLLCGSPGAVIMGGSIFRRRRIRKDNMAALEKEIAGISYEELEERVREKNYHVLGSAEKRQKFEMDEYANKVINRVMGEEYLLPRRLPTLGGIGIMAVGGYYILQNGYANAGRIIAIVGVVVAILSECNGVRKKWKLKKDIERVINEKGYEFMKLHARNKNHYDFYQRHILPELQSKQKD